MSTTLHLARARLLRIVGFADLALALVCATTPAIRSYLGPSVALVLAAFLLAGAMVMFVMAWRTERSAATLATAGTFSHVDAGRRAGAIR